jgi:histidinol dehydrogenase
LLDISTILVAGGPAALAALAFGTKKSAPVQKVLASGGARTIVGLHHLSGYVGVELCAGNSEICFICDDSTTIDMVAGDILGCADRDPEASVFLFHSSDKWIHSLVEKLAALVADVKDLQSRETIQRCLEKNFFCFICKDLSEAFELSNRLGPGTLSVQVENASEHLEKIEVAGQVLLGSYSPPTATDLIGGAAGLVSTWGSAAFSSSLSPAAFMRRFPYVEVSKEALERTHAESRKLAEEEGFHEREPSFVARIGN